MLGPKPEQRQTGARPLTADGSEDLEGHVSDLLHAEGQEPVPPENLEGAEPQQLHHDANMSVMLEPVQHPHAGAGNRQWDDGFSPGGRGTR